MRGAFADAPEALEECCKSFVALQAWPLLEGLDWEGWLGNFNGNDELYFARCLLEGFVYYNEAHSNALFRAAFHGLSRKFIDSTTSSRDAHVAWSTFCAKAVFTYVEGEVPSPSESGLGFARRTRKLLEVPEDRIVAPKEALEALHRAPSTPIVFVDDFLGSGRQLLSTWRRDYGNGQSFESIGVQSGLSAWYIPLLATEYGLDQVGKEANGLEVAPAYRLSQRYSALHTDSLVWPAGQEAAGVEFVERVSLRAGYGESECWGFHDLALAVAILDTIPDASLPLFYSERNGWHPLMRRR